MLKGKESIHFNADASNTELLFRIIHSVNQLSIYGSVSHCCAQFGLTEEENGTRKISRQRRFREQRNTEKRECTRSKLFGTSSKTRPGKPVCGKRITVPDDSFHKGLPRRIVLALGIGWYEIQDQTWRGRRFWTNHNIMSKIHTFSRRPTLQSLCSNSWRTTIGSVIEVHIGKIIDNFGFEIAIPSPNNPRRTSCVLKYLHSEKSQNVKKSHNAEKIGMWILLENSVKRMKTKVKMVKWKWYIYIHRYIWKNQKRAQKSGWTRMAGARPLIKHGVSCICNTVRAVEHHWRSVINASALPAEDPA